MFAKLKGRLAPGPLEYHGTTEVEISEMRAGGEQIDFVDGRHRALEPLDRDHVVIADPIHHVDERAERRRLS